jgi:hypothetical protein
MGLQSLCLVASAINKACNAACVTTHLFQNFYFHFICIFKLFGLHYIEANN